jgi:hypothetical protein
MQGVLWEIRRFLNVGPASRYAVPRIERMPYDKSGVQRNPRSSVRKGFYKQGPKD